ncbi:MAG: hypothetical protein KDE31_17590, partial [Caldilineaceae bacterium]|nr:hypothetical protein [Caldilineaceae bacterium]
AFLDSTVDYLIPVEAGKLGGRYPTPYSTFVRLRAEEQSPAPAQPATRAPAAPRAAAPTKRKLSWKEQRELETIEAQIAAWETAKPEALDAMSHCGDDYIKLQKLSDEITVLDDKLEGVLERWLELSEV